VQAFEGIESPQDLPEDRVVEHQGQDAESADDSEPDHRDGSEIHADAPGADLLEPEDADEDEHGGGRDEVFEEAGRERTVQAFVGLLDAFQGGDDRDRGGDDPVAVEQGGAEDAEQHEEATVLSFGLLLVLGGRQGDQGHDAAFAVLVGFHDQEHIFDHHHEDQRPDDQGQDRDDLRGPEDVVVGVLDPQAFLEGVERAGPDITEDDSEGRDGGRHGQWLGGGGAFGRLRVGRAHGELFTVTAPRG
jgi:hypothetical protein